MADERLRELERRWRETKSRDDERTFLRERRRVLDRPADRLRLDVLEYDAVTTRAEVARLLDDRVRRLEAARVPSPDAVPDPGTQLVVRVPEDPWTLPLSRELDRLLAAQLGVWFEGLGSGFGGERWCHCHSFFGYQLPPRSADVPKAVDGVIEHLGQVHGFHVKLLALFDATPLPEASAAAFEAALRDALRRIVDLVVLETGCDDAWYVKPHRALELLLADKDVVLPEALLAELERAFSARFQSWIAPTPESTAAVAESVALALVRARFEARYGPGWPLPHLTATLAMDWDRPPADIRALLERIDSLPWVETDDHERYLVTVDAPAHSDPGRHERYRHALSEICVLADAGAVLDLALMTRIQETVLGTSAPIRTTTAFARTGTEAYAAFDGLEAMLRRKVAADAADGCHPLVQACRLYLDVIFFHPFADGNARAARLWFEFLLRRERVPAPPLEDVVRLEKVAGDEAAAWRLVRLSAKRLLATRLCDT